jgi:hypothetical protein
MTLSEQPNYHSNGSSGPSASVQHSNEQKLAVLEKLAKARLEGTPQEPIRDEANISQPQSGNWFYQLKMGYIKADKNKHPNLTKLMVKHRMEKARAAITPAIRKRALETRNKNAQHSPKVKAPQSQVTTRKIPRPAFELKRPAVMRPVDVTVNIAQQLSKIAHDHDRYYETIDRCLAIVNEALKL